MKRQSYIDVEQEGKHVRLRCGQITMHSEDYYDEATARRAARMLVKAINTRPMRLTVQKRGQKFSELVRKVWVGGSGRPVVLPVDGGPDAFRMPYFDPALETIGT